MIFSRKGNRFRNIILWLENRFNRKLRLPVIFVVAIDNIAQIILRIAPDLTALAR